MSGASSDQLLTEAYELIEAERHEEAQAILKPILEQEPDNVDAWWLYAHAATDPETGRMALNQVLRIDDSYEEAQALLTQLDEHVPATQDSAVSPPHLPEDGDISGGDLEGFSLDDTGPIFDDRVEPRETREASGSGRRIALIVLAIIALLIVAGVLLLNPFATPGTPQPTTQATAMSTSVAQQVEPTVTPEVAPSSVVPALDPVTEEVSSALTETLAGFDLIENGVGTEQTSLGKTVLVSICTTTGTMRDTLDRSMEAVAVAGSEVPDDIEAVGVALIECDSGRILRIIATSVEDAVAFTSGEIDSTGYQARWIAAA